MANNTKEDALKLFRKISAYNTIVKQNIGQYLNKFSPYAKEYESTLDLVLDVLRALGYDERRLITEILEMITGEADIASVVESGYHGALNSLEEKLSLIESKQSSNSFIYELEDGVKVVISSILTALLTCSVSPFIPKRCLDTFYKKKYHDAPDPSMHPINIPTVLLDFSNTLHVSPVSESGIYFYNTGSNIKYYKLDTAEPITSTALLAGSKDPNAEKLVKYTYRELQPDEIRDDMKFKKVVSVKKEIYVREGQATPDEFIYTIRPKFTAEGLYKTDDMNAFIWYVANRGDNTDGMAGNNSMYEYNKMMWDSRRMNNREADERKRFTGEDWKNWLNSKTDYDEDNGILKLVKDEKQIDSLYPILQLEPSVDYGDHEHIVATFPAQRYIWVDKPIKEKVTWNIPGTDTKLAEFNIDTAITITKTIYHFNADYLKSIKIFNWKTIIMNMLYELNGISPVPDIRINISLSDEIIDARLSTLILNTIIADDKEVDDSFYSFSNEDYIDAIRRMELLKYGAKDYKTASTTAIQNPANSALDAMNSVSTAATKNDITTTIQRQLYNVEGTSGSTGVTNTTLSASLLMETNFIHELLFAIIKPFVRALLSPQVMLLFIINLDTMGLINIQEIGESADMMVVSDFIFRKISGIIKKMIIFIKNKIIKYLFELAKKLIKDLIDKVIIMILLEQLNDYIRLLTQILDCIRRFGIGVTVSGIDEVTYADIIPEANGPVENTE